MKEAPRQIEKHPALRQVGRLLERSKFKRSTIETPDCELEIEGNRFRVESIQNREHPDLAQVQRLLVETFGEEEVDPEEILRNAVEGKNVSGEEEGVKYKVYTIKNGEGRVVSMLTGGLLDIQDKNGANTGETLFMVAYCVTDKNARQNGLAREAYISAIVDVVKESELQGKTLSFAAGECVSTSEKFWNNVGWKRVYKAHAPGDAKEYDELKYVQPPLDFNTATGESSEGAGEAPEHLMIDSFERMSPSKEQIVRTVQAFYRWCNIWPHEAFESEEAYEKHLEYSTRQEQKFIDDIKNGGSLIYLDQKSREKGRGKGVIIHDYEEADHSDAKTEDF